MFFEIRYTAFKDSLFTFLLRKYLNVIFQKNVHKKHENDG
jgi:hypothetical protein